ncbi:hypothetical protein WSM22_45770 [Cytophagales bacterium WSM2-2]|nr:hypothetical protein WSM22_45770 [Cytophagales bacterium WSM2-2]
MVGCKDQNKDPGPTPTVSSTTPATSAVGVERNAVITASFSAAMSPVSISASTFTLLKGTSVVAGAVTYSGTTATFTPTSSLDASTVYSATITKGAKAASGSSLAADNVWTFTTVGLPAANLTDPLDNATAVSQSKVIAITFSGAMDPSTITSSTFTLKQGTTAVAGAVAYSGTTGTFTPTVALAANTIYTATVTTGAKNMAGDAILANKVWTFTTVVLPEVISTDPINNAIGVIKTKVVALTFSKAMNATTITATTFTVKQGATAVAGIVAYSGITATFTPSANLTASAIYTATVTTEVKDVAGSALAANKVWSFTVASAAAAGLAVVDLGSAGDYVILAKTAISNISSSAVTGDLGLSPAATSYVTGFSLTNATGYATSAQITGKIFAADMAAPTPINLTTAVNNMITAYNDAAGRPSPDFSELGTGNIGGKILVPGLYKWTNTVTIPSDVTISGNATDVWIFQIAGDLTMSNAVNITLTGGALAKNIFWQVAGTATLGTTSHFEGVILSKTAITIQTGASFHGRALAQTAVVLDGNAVTKPQ